MFKHHQTLFLHHPFPLPATSLIVSAASVIFHLSRRSPSPPPPPSPSPSTATAAVQNRQSYAENSRNLCRYT
jgi:hypothetical protein